MGEIGVNKLFFHNEKVKNILNTIKLNYEKPDTSYPVSVELSLTNRCNLKCVWCVDWHLRKLDKSEIEFDILKKLILDLERGGTKGITIEGGGEPTCYSHFKELMKIIENVNIKFGLITNGVMIPYIDHIEKFEWIRVSIDVDSEDNYHKYKKGNRKDYNNLFKNLHKLVIASKKRTVIGASYIATKYNMDNIISVIKKVRDIGVDYFYIRPVEDCELLLPSEDCFKGLEKYSTDKFRMLVNYSDRLICGNLGLPCVSHSLSSVIT